MHPTGLTADNARVQRVSNFDELLRTRFENGVNALCWERRLDGDFEEVIRKLKLEGGINPLDEEELESLELSEAGKKAVEQMLSDMRKLRSLGLAPELNGVIGYERDDDPGLLRTDVYSFHADRATDEADTWLCTYLGPSSEGLKNEEALRHIDDPETRAMLLDDYGGKDDEGFAEYLADYCYDLHYAPRPGAEVYSFGVWNLWRIAVDYPGCPVPPCIHRAPDSLPGDPSRLLLIA
ncbi:hypothetical protein ACFQY0_10375 [Haloferula chungangensis]|uniref:DUF1877 family protein n=1 Tax=Haloferula chungangensis TaxID=1048331 RepID=A0ABW2L7F8_9BACT